MAIIKPFSPLMYTKKSGDISKNVCPPYDIINPEQRAALVEKSEYNLIRLELPTGENKYDSAAKLLKSWIANGIIAREDSDGIFIYEEEFELKNRRYVFDGLVCLCKTYDFSEKVVLPHEETLSKAKQDRFDLMSTTFCNFSSVYSLYNDDEKQIQPIIDMQKQSAPIFEFTDSESVTHRLWKICDSKINDKIVKFFEPKQLFIADGHHRFETGAKFNKYCIENNISDADSGFIMMTLVDMNNDGLVIFPTHRLVYNMKIDVDSLLQKAKSYFKITRYTDISQIESVLSQNSSLHSYVLYAANGGFWLLVGDENACKVKADGRSDAYKSLDVTVLHSLVLEQILGIDKENMANQVNLHYTRSIDEAVSSVDNGDASVAFILNPTKIGEIKDVAIASDKMPQKSTYFYPKLVTGLIFNTLKKNI